MPGDPVVVITDVTGTGESIPQVQVRRFKEPTGSSGTQLSGLPAPMEDPSG